MTDSAPTLLAQLTDPHVRVGRNDRDSAKALAAAVRAVIALESPPNAVIVTGDLVNDPSARAYERVRELLAPLPMPVFVLAGNHDDPDGLREYFALDDAPTGSVGEPFRYTAKVGGLRLVGADTTVPGQDGGSLDFERRAWIEAELASDRDTPTILAIHHPPIEIGVQALDVIGLPPADRIALADLLALNPQVRRVIAGHVHRTAFGVVGGCGVVTCASTHLQTPLELPGAPPDDLQLFPEIPGFLLHALIEGDITTHVQPIAT